MAASDPQDDLRKLIKYEEKLCVDANHNDHFEQLFKRTTESFRAKIDINNEAQRGSKSAFNTSDHNGYAKDDLKLTETKNSLSQEILQKARAHVHKGKENVIPDNLQHIQEQHPKKVNVKSNVNQALGVVSLRSNTGLEPSIKGSSATLIERRQNRSKYELPAQWSTKQLNVHENQKLLKTDGTVKKNFRNNPKNASNQSISLRSVSSNHAVGASIANGIAKSDKKGETGRSSDDSCSTRSRAKQNQVHFRTRSQSRKQKPSNSDPVALYQYYQREWRHFREQIPGESSHMPLRWAIRNKLMT